MPAALLLLRWASKAWWVTLAEVLTWQTGTMCGTKSSAHKTSFKNAMTGGYFANLDPQRGFK